MSTITLMPARVGRGDQVVEVVQGAQLGRDVAVVVHVVAAVGQRRGVERAEPDGVHAQVGQVADPRGDAGQVADAVAVAVGEAARIDLVDRRLPPPVGVQGGVAGEQHLVGQLVIPLGFLKALALV